MQIVSIFVFVAFKLNEYGRHGMRLNRNIFIYYMYYRIASDTNDVNNLVNLDKRGHIEKVMTFMSHGFDGIRATPIELLAIISAAAIIIRRHLNSNC